MISERQLELMKPTAILVNTCRGPVVDEVALHKALITKRIVGAGLDVMVDEPPSKDNPLLNVENITITPHTAGPTWENWPKAFRNAFDNILRLPEHEEDALGVRFVLLDELLSMSDVVTLHVPLSAQTKDMISERQLGLMKPTAVLVNTCRGPVVDEVALHKALITKKIAGAGLDVMTDEPPSKDNPLLNVENITITPHTAGPTWENWAKAFRNAFDNILRVHAGRKPMWVIPELRHLV